MTRAWALVRASWLAASSYRVRFLLSLAGVLVIVLPVYFLSGALQPLLSNAIRDEGGQYFGFLLVGLATTYYLGAAVLELPTAISGGIGNGTLEALLSTPIRFPSLIAGMTGFRLLYTTLRVLVLLLVGWGLGAGIEWSRIGFGAIVLALIFLAHLPFGIITSAMIIMFRTQLAIPQAVMALSVFLGGVYYPSKVIPSWIQGISGMLPLTYGLRALRRLILEGASPVAVAGDVAVLAGFAVVLLAGSAVVLAYAMRYARRMGSLSQY